MVLTYPLNRWEESKTQLNPSYTAIYPSEHISLKICSIIMKYNESNDISSQNYTQFVASAVIYMLFSIFNITNF